MNRIREMDVRLLGTEANIDEKWIHLSKKMLNLKAPATKQSGYLGYYEKIKFNYRNRGRKRKKKQG